ncbi:hypothetical protein [Mucilaginibacter sp. SJ]|uniref:hypothetical protein n=1 Tax=Mucilaginibacter sp. SJ TaxID=3029053 RepID=UPI0023A95FC6|nr:hypothetical protein [Mucilaginibacter sp. SJ]WEA03742.1 hypothetical protein MusilaSJ_12440 [Mucilaginibacter sp. SJ]
MSPAKRTGIGKGLKNSIKKITVLGNDSPLTYKIVGKISWSAVPGLLYIPIPERQQDEYMSVIKIELNGKLYLYHGKGRFLINE